MIINESFRDLIAPLGALEFAQLEANILVDGIRDPLIVWGNVLIDGHNRYEISQKHGLTFQTTAKDFADEDEAKIWIIRNQLGRRNLNPTQIEYLRGQRYELQKKSSGAPAGNDNAKKQRGQNDPFVSEDVAKKEKTADRMAKEYGVTAKTIKRDGKMAKAIDAIGGEAKKKILAGEVAINKKELEKLAIAPKEKIAAVAKQIEDGTYEKPSKSQVIVEDESEVEEYPEIVKPTKAEFKKRFDEGIRESSAPHRTTPLSKIMDKVNGMTFGLTQYFTSIEESAKGLSDEDTEIVNRACDEQYREFHQFLRRVFDV